MDTWNSVIFMKSNKPWSDLKAMMKWDGIQGMWSTTGDWDWCVQLNEKHSTPEKTEAFVAMMRKDNWATATKTNWWKSVMK